MNVEKAFEVVEVGLEKAVALQEKLRGEKVKVSRKLEAKKKKKQALQVENVKLTDEVARLTEEINRHKVVEKSVKELTEKVESLPVQVAEAIKVTPKHAVGDFKKSSEFVALLKYQHRMSVAENVKLYHDRGWLNTEKFRADREADRAAARAEKEEAAKEAKATRQREGRLIATQQA